MGVKVASTSLLLHQWTAQPIVHHSSSPSQTLTSGNISSPSKRRSIGHDGRSLSYRFVPRRLNYSTLFGTPSTKLHRSKSCELWGSSKPNKTQSIPRVCSASLDPFFEDEFSKKIQELTLRFHAYEERVTSSDSEPMIIHDSVNDRSYSVTDGDGFDGSEQFRTFTPEGASQLSSSTTLGSETSVSGQDEYKLWNSMVEEAEQMQYSKTNDALDQETRKQFVSPVDARVEAIELTNYFKTELLYQTALSQEPNNPLLLANYAQFLYLVSNHYDRAEEYFKRAIGVEPKDAEALSKYATFLWRARDDLWAAEEIFLEAIDADPTNTYYAANYANFLWNTGGDDTCFPLDEPHEDTI